MLNNLSTLAWAKLLITRASITPDDQDCQRLIGNYLAALGFATTHLSFGSVSNLWARYGTQAPLLVFLGHTDVVPTGDTQQWRFPPFSPTEHNGYLYGRGAADMKGNIAAMLTACTNFIKDQPNFAGSIAFLLTSDEEGPAVDGTQKVLQYLQQQGVVIDWCLVGEPSSGEQLGDTLKVGRRGSLSFTLEIHGKQGHIAYPHLAENPIHHSLAPLLALIQTTWDTGNEFFPATALQFSNIHSGVGTENVIPATLTAQGNFRYSSAVTAAQLREHFEAILQQQAINYTLQWRHSAEPFLTRGGPLIDACVQTIEQQLAITPLLATTGGTSDGRFVAPLGTEVVELGLSNATIHQVDECAKIADIEQLSILYTGILQRLFK